MGLIVDTSALVAMERRQLPVSSIRDRIGAEPVAIPAIVWAELLVGVRLAATADLAARRRARLEQIRRHVPIIDFDARIAEHYADIHAECLKKGTMIPQNDMVVAATARCLGYKILVGPQDEVHFRSVNQIAVISLERIGHGNR
jgi:tRNA(fMet)-specific endonuclease VapC